MKTSRVVLVLLVVVVAGIASWYFFGKQRPPQDPTATWLTIYDPENSVIAKYPANFRSEEAPEGFHYLPTLRISLYSDAANYHPINYSQDGWIIIDSDTLTESQCFTPPEIGGAVAFDKTATINGVTWKMMSYSDAGLGNRYETDLYRTMRDGECYEIVSTLHYASDFTDLDELAMAYSQESMRAQMSAIVYTVAFK